jgi:hypothetical protein
MHPSARPPLRGLRQPAFEPKLRLGLAHARVRQREKSASPVDLRAFRARVQFDQGLAGSHGLPLAHKNAIHPATRALRRDNDQRSGDACVVGRDKRSKVKPPQDEQTNQNQCESGDDATKA